MDDSNIAYNADIADSYDNDRENEDHWAMENMFVERYFAEKTDSKTILDVPIGTGRFLHLYPDKARIIGVDLSCPMVAKAKEKALQVKKLNVDFSVADARKLNFIGDGGVDVIVCCRLFHLIERQQRLEVLQEFARVLQGELILQVYLDVKKRNVVYRLAAGLLRVLKRSLNEVSGKQPRKKPWAHISSYSLDEAGLLELCEKTGFQIVNRTNLCIYSGLSVGMFVLQNSK